MPNMFTNTNNVDANTPINNIKYPTNETLSIMKNSHAFYKPYLLTA